jgi:hypothetical protein
LLPLSALPARAEPEPPPIAVFSAGPEVGYRKVSYRDRVTPSLASFQSGATALFVASLAVYPTYGHGLPVVSDLGVFGSVSRSLRAHTAGPDAATSFDNLWHAWEIGGRWRGVFDGEERLGASIRYGSLRYDFSGGSVSGVLLPSGTLQYWRPGVELRQPLGPVAFELSLGYLALVMQDAIGRAFPRSSHGGVEAALSATLSIDRRFEVRLSGKYTRIYYSLHPLPGDTYVAGGALDEYAVVDLALALRW